MDKLSKGRPLNFIWSLPVVALLFFGCDHLAQGRNEYQVNNSYYVATTGNDSNLGTSKDLPWLTIQKAADSMVPGDTVTVLPGTYNERVHVTVSGISGAPITYQADGTVKMKGFSVAADYITLKGFDISNTDDDTKEGLGIFVEGSFCQIEGNYVHFATRGGIKIWARPGNELKTSHCTVKNNRLYRNALSGIEVHGRDNLIEENEIWGTIQYHPNWIDPPNWVDADGIRFFGSGHTIRKNFIHDIKYGIPENVNPHIDCFQTWSDANHEGAKNILLEQNVCKNAQFNSTGEIGKGLIAKDARNILIQNNLIKAFSGVHINNSEQITIVNNVFSSDLSLYTTYGPIGITLNETPDSIIMNNIFYDLSGRAVDVKDSTSQLGLKAGYNCVYRSDGVKPSGTPYPHDLWNVNPKFVNPGANDFHLQLRSPAIDAGITLAEVTDDFDDNIRPQGEGYDIGAYENPFLEIILLPLITSGPNPISRYTSPRSHT